jgi:enoyl-CoA hydratase
MPDIDKLETLLLDISGPVATITLNRPKVLHALNTHVFDELEAIVTSLSQNNSVRAILIVGSGDRAFAAGADIKELIHLDRVTGEQKSLRGQSVFGLIESSHKPVIALINGFALGGGCELALACHIRIANENARLGQPEVKLGLLPGYGGSQRLPRLVGRSAALKLLLTGDVIDAAEAHRIGLVDEVVVSAPGEAYVDLMARGRELALTIAAQAPLAVAACLDAVRQGADLHLDQALALEARLFGDLCATADKQEGTHAFLEKRVPQWTDK